MYASSIQYFKTKDRHEDSKTQRFTKNNKKRLTPNVNLKKFSDTLLNVIEKYSINKINFKVDLY